MRVRGGTILRFLLLPGGILLLGAAVLAHSAWLAISLPALSFLYYCAMAGGMLLAWRFHSSRIFLALLVLFLAQQATTLFETGHATAGTPGWTALQAVALLVPLNLVLIALMHERGFMASSLAPIGLLLFVQSVAVAVLCSGPVLLPPRMHHVPAAAPLPAYALFVLVAAGVPLLVRSLITRKPADSALLWSLAAFAMSLFFRETPRASIAYWTAAACVLTVAVVENSYLLAYHDELTTLPSRRALNHALLQLADPYAIAVADIDHFKRFNDTYGHDTGDQVLRLVAAQLSRVSGGGQAYRCGGEEFAILFPGKTVPEVVDHLEDVRTRVEGCEFHLRGKDRRQIPRGPDRRNAKTRGRARRGYAIRQLVQEKPRTPLSVTVSIGVAASTAERPHPELVLQTADKALYRAKANGRNRIEAASAAPRRSRMPASDIA